MQQLEAWRGRWLGGGEGSLGRGGSVTGQQQSTLLPRRPGPDAANAPHDRGLAGSLIDQGPCDPSPAKLSSLQEAKKGEAGGMGAQLPAPDGAAELPEIRVPTMGGCVEAPVSRPEEMSGLRTINPLRPAAPIRRGTGSGGCSQPPLSVPAKGLSLLLQTGSLWDHTCE